MTMVTIDNKNVTLFIRKIDDLERRLRRGAFRRSSRRIGKEMTRLHLWLTSTWDQPVIPTIKVRSSSGNFSIESETDDELFSLLSFGAAAHRIMPVNASMLVFPWGGKGSYIPKSVPGKAAQAGSGRFTGPLVYRGFVNHPGFRPRNFHETIAKKILPFARKVIAEEVARELART